MKIRDIVLGKNIHNCGKSFQESSITMAIPIVKKVLLFLFTHSFIDMTIHNRQ